MVLAAGYGTRLKPLTERMPKPLVPVAGRPMIEYALDRLLAYGIEEVVVNVSHHKGQLIDYLSAFKSLSFTISEEAEPLETGGDRGFVGDVHRKRPRALAERRGLRFDTVDAARREHDARAGGVQHAREMPAQAARRAGDERRAPVEREARRDLVGAHDAPPGAPSPYAAARARDCATSRLRITKSCLTPAPSRT